MFEPSALGRGPSGLADWPRPFVFRATHLDGSTVKPGAAFHFDLNLFDMRSPAIANLVAAFAQLANEGLGPGRGRAELREVWQRSEPAVRVYDGQSLLRTVAPLELSLGVAQAGLPAPRCGCVS